MERIVSANTWLEIAEKKKLAKEAARNVKDETKEQKEARQEAIKQKIALLPRRYICLKINTDDYLNVQKDKKKRAALESTMSRDLDIASKVWRDDEPPADVLEKFFESLPKEMKEVTAGNEQEIGVWEVTYAGSDTSKMFRDSFKEKTGWEKPKKGRAESLPAQVKNAQNVMLDLYRKISAGTATDEEREKYEKLLSLVTESEEEEETEEAGEEEEETGEEETGE